MHSFTGGREEAEDMLTLHPRMLIGINGCSLKTHDNLDNMAAIPLRRLMLETDAPWCDMRPTHASAEHVATRREAVDKKKHTRDCLVKGRNEPCNIDQVRVCFALSVFFFCAVACAEDSFRRAQQRRAPVAAQGEQWCLTAVPPMRQLTLW